MSTWGTSVRVGLLAVAAGAGLIVGACALERGVSCGDGWWDVAYEDCEPTRPESFRDACRELDPRFDVDASCSASCEIVADIDSCNRCGDGVRAGMEACDGQDFLAGLACPEGSTGALGCAPDCTVDFSACASPDASAETCGNGKLDPYEECDPGITCDLDADCPAASPICDAAIHECMPAAPDGGPANACAGYEVTAWNHGKDQPVYTGGSVGPCTNECVFDREQCNFCGDGELDEGYNDLGWPDVHYDQDAEICDGQADPEVLSAECFQYCGILPAPGLTIRCAYSGCTEDCQEIEFGGFVGTGCCAQAGAPCSPAGYEGLPCCYWVDHPGSWGQCTPTLGGPVCPGFNTPPLAPEPNG